MTKNNTKSSNLTDSIDLSKWKDSLQTVEKMTPVLIREVGKSLKNDFAKAYRCAHEVSKYV